MRSKTNFKKVKVVLFLALIINLLIIESTISNAPAKVPDEINKEFTNKINSELVENSDLINSNLNPELEEGTVFGEPIQITPQKLQPEQYDIVQDGNGTYHIVWLQSITPESLSIMYSYSFKNGSWSKAETIYQLYKEIESPKILLDSEGGIHIVFYSASGYIYRIYYFYCEPNQNIFIEEIIYETREYEFLQLSLALTHNDTVNVLWLAENLESTSQKWYTHVSLLRKNITNSLWISNPIILFNESNPKLFAVTSTYDSLRISWIKSTNYAPDYFIMYTEFNETTSLWSTDLEIKSFEDSLEYIFIKPRSDGGNHIYWVQRPLYFNLEYGILLENGSLVNILTQINTENTNVHYADFVEDVEHNCNFLVYQEDYGIYQNIFARVYFYSNSTWSNATQITFNGDSFDPSVFVEFNSSDLIASSFHIDNGALKKISLFNNFTLTNSITIYNGGNNFYHPSTAIDSQGTIHLVSYHISSGQQEIYYQRKFANETFWGGYQTVTDDLVTETGIFLIVDENDTLHCFYINYDDIYSNHLAIYEKTKEINSSEWSTAKLVFVPSDEVLPLSYYLYVFTDPSALQLFYDEDQNLHLFWCQIVGEYSKIGYSVREVHAENFSEPIILPNFQATAHAFHFNALIDQDGILHLANCEYSTEYSVISTVYRYCELDGSWSEPEIVIASYDFMTKPTLMLKSDGSLELFVTEWEILSLWRSIFVTDFHLFTKSAGSTIWQQEGRILKECGTAGYYDLVQLEDNSLYLVYYEIGDLNTIWWRDINFESLRISTRNPDGIWEDNIQLFTLNYDKSLPVILYNNVTKNVEIILELNSFIFSISVQNDTDLDLLGDRDELLFGTDPLQSDTDGDSLSDGEEIKNYNTNPITADTDWDNLTDGLEINIYDSNPLSIDTDRDTILDGDEVYIYNTNPSSRDSDEDLIQDNIELFVLGTNPNSIDTDSDGIDDFYEYDNGLNPNLDDSQEDPDADGLDNIGEYLAGTGVFTSDTDSDLLLDGEEVNEYTTDPLNADTDSDTLTDWEEVMKFGTSPFLRDSDNDGFTDREEIDEGTDPMNPNDNIRSRRLRTTLIATITPALLIAGLVIFIEFQYRHRSKNQQAEEKDLIIKAEDELATLRDENGNNY